MHSLVDFKRLAQQYELVSLSSEEKEKLSRQILEKLVYKFPRAIDTALFEALSRILVLVEPSFISQRSAFHLAKLAYFIYFIRRKLSRNMTLFPFKEYMDLRLFSSHLYFTFGSKPVLSVLVHAHLKDKYGLFDEEQVLFIIRKCIAEVQVVKDSLYVFQPPKNKLKTLYFEIDKKSGLPFTSGEIKQLKIVLKQELKFSIEQLVPRVFMIRNEEEVLKNILTLSREIHFLSDLPQVMILFDQQTSQQVIFTIILVKVLKVGQPNIQESFTKIQSDAEYVPERRQIVRYLRKKCPLEANVFRLKLLKDPSLLRIDLSLHFYLARQKISQILEKTIGEFRDYNGGIIIKQREVLVSFKEAFPETSLKEPDLIENFYYSLTPIEVQAILPLESLKIFFQLFLEAKTFQFIKSSDFFFKISMS